MNIFVIDKATKQNLGTIDFIPKIEERIILNNDRNLECVVCCVVYNPREHGVFIFVNVVENYYNKMISEIKWS